MELDAADGADGRGGRVSGSRTHVTYAGYAEPSARRERRGGLTGNAVMTMVNTRRTGVQHNARKIVQNDHGTDKATLAQTVAVP